MDVREANPEDAPAIARVQIASWRAAYSGLLPDSALAGLDLNKHVAFWSRVISRREGIVLVGLQELDIVGFCHLTRTRDRNGDRARVAEITAIYVSPQHWQRGMGRLLVAQALASCIQDGLPMITLWVLEDNVPARSFYEALGFVTDGARKLDLEFQLPEVRYTISVEDKRLTVVET